MWRPTNWATPRYVFLFLRFGSDKWSNPLVSEPEPLVFFIFLAFSPFFGGIRSGGATAACSSQTTRAANCATAGYSVFAVSYNYYSIPQNLSFVNDGPFSLRKSIFIIGMKTPLAAAAARFLVFSSGSSPGRGGWGHSPRLGASVTLVCKTFSVFFRLKSRKGGPGELPRIWVQRRRCLLFNKNDFPAFSC